MKPVLAAVAIFGTMWVTTSAVAAQSLSVGPSAKVTVAVIEFTPGANASTMTHEAKRQLQASVAFSMVQSDRFDVHDVRRTREASQGQLLAINHDSSTTAAVRVGKQLGVTYILTGTVTEYTAQGDGGFGYATLRTRLVEVATGRVRYSGETIQKGTSVMRTSGHAEMQTKVLKPAIAQLTAALVATL